MTQSRGSIAVIALIGVSLAVFANAWPALAQPPAGTDPSVAPSGLERAYPLHVEKECCSSKPVQVAAVEAPRPDAGESGSGWNPLPIVAVVVLGTVGLLVLFRVVPVTVGMPRPGVTRWRVRLPRAPRFERLRARWRVRLPRAPRWEGLRTWLRARRPRPPSREDLRSRNRDREPGARWEGLRLWWWDRRPRAARWQGVRADPRPRTVSPWLIVVAWPLFRYSEWRDAYVLRLVGERLGPVLKSRR